MSVQAKFVFNPAMIVPILGWLYIAVGLIWPFQHIALIIIWWIDIFLSVVVHAVQIFVALPIAKQHGFSATKSAIYTFVFGATWWHPLRESLKQKA